MPAIDGPITIRVNRSSQNITFDRSTGVIPTVLDLIVNTIGRPAFSVYWNIQFENTSVEWLNYLGSTEGFLNYENNTGSLSLAVDNLDLLFGSNYRATIYFTASDEDGNISTVTSIVNLSLSGDNATAVKTDKKNYNLLYNRETNVISGDTTVNILNNTAADSITLDTIGTLLKESIFTDTFNLEEDPAFPFATNSELPPMGSTVVSCRLKKAGVFIYAFTTTIQVIQNDKLVVMPSDFAFTLRNGFNETKTDVLKVINPGNENFTVTFPAFITGSASSGSGNLDITLTTVNSDSLSQGEYKGNVVISHGAETISVPVILTVLEFVTLATKDYNFCLDDVYLNANKITEAGRYLQISLNANFTSASGSEDVMAVYAIPYFQDKVKTDIGQKIQNLFPLFKASLFGNSAVDFNNTFVYKPAKVTIKVDEVDANYNIQSSKTFTDILFFAGNKPKLFPLFSNYYLRRKFAGSPHIFTYYTGLLAPEDFTEVSPTQNNITANAIETVFLPQNAFSERKILEKTGLKFLEFPNVEEQVYVQWLNKNLVPEIAVFSGDYTVPEDIEQTFNRFEFNSKKYEAKDFATLQINTGWILEEEVQMIKELVKSPICFIKIKDKVYECFSTTSKLPITDKNRNKIAFDLEFLIVKNK